MYDEFEDRYEIRYDYPFSEPYSPYLPEKVFMTVAKEKINATLSTAIYPTNANFNYGLFAIYMEVLTLCLFAFFWVMLQK